MAGIESSSSSSSSEDISRTENSSTGTAPGLEGLLQKRRCELMYELKNLQHGERPVTGTDSRSQVNNFFARHLRQARSDVPVANIDDVEEHRPQQVTVEVQGLVQRRSVSAVLQSQSFRRSLEAAIGRHVTNNSPIRRRSNRGRPNIGGTSTENVEQPPSQLEQSSLQPQPEARVPPTPHVSPPPAPTLPEERTGEVLRPERNLRDIRHDDLVMEISELVHRQLVSETLNGDFRGTLENSVRDHIQASGTDPNMSLNAITNLPPSNIRRNDFSHFGIIPPQAQANSDIDDAVSLVSATATATIPFAQTNAAVNRELHSLKTQIAELTSMLKVSMELQVDMQRSIRQEVAAAISHATAGPIPTVPSHLRGTRADESKCLICLDNGADAVFYRCGHLCSCYTCAMKLKAQQANCPVCRAPIADIMRTYRISHE